MFISGLAALVLALLLPVLGLVLLYAIVRMAVRDGMRDALRADEAERVRSELRLGKERSPNQS